MKEQKITVRNMGELHRICMLKCQVFIKDPEKKKERKLLGTQTSWNFILALQSQLFGI
jgi:hypothetical protein